MNIEYTGHSLFDIGLATICAYSEKKYPSDLAEADFSRVADYLAENFVVNPLKSFLTVAFTKNAWFAQNAYNPETAKNSDEKKKRIDKRNDLAKNHLQSWKELGNKNESCVFTGLPSLSSALSGKLQTGRAGRAQIPLTQGDVDINFYPYGDSGLPVSGIAMLCLQAFPLGCAKCGGKLLGVHSTNSGITLSFASVFLRENLRLIKLAQQENSSKLPESKRSAKTLLIETLLKAETEAFYLRNPASISAYYFTNGQQPYIDIFNLPLEITGFLAKVLTATYKPAWNKIVSRGWQIAENPKRNMIYEDVFYLPQNAASFIRTYFLRLPQKSAKKDNPTKNYQIRNEFNLVSWKLVKLFLERVLLMTTERIENIRKLGDRLANYVSEENDSRFFRTFFIEQRYDFFRTGLLKALNANLKKGDTPLITLDEYLSVFEEGEEVAYSNWRLARDLVLIKMIEELHKSGWLRNNTDALPEPDELVEDNS